MVGLLWEGRSVVGLVKLREERSVVGLVRPLQARLQAQALLHLVLERHKQEPLLTHLPHLPHRQWGRSGRLLVGRLGLLQGQQQASVPQLPSPPLLLLLVPRRVPRSELLLPLPSALQLSRQRRVCSVVGLVRPLQARLQAQALLHLVLERHKQEPLLTHLPHLPHRQWGRSGRLLVGRLGLLQGQQQASVPQLPSPPLLLLLVPRRVPRSELLLPLPSALQLSRQRRVCSVVGLLRPLQARLQARLQAQALLHLVLERHQEEPLLPHLPHRH